jgi:uncharacterized alkaline shock family protein YloU
MSESAAHYQSGSSVRDPAGEGGRPSEASRGGGSAGLRGRTTIADGVVEKIAGLAVREVIGVHAMGSGMARTLGTVRERVPGASRSVSQGVKVEVGESQTAIDLEIVIDYGVAIADVARAVREDVIYAVERMTGLEVVEVNIAVSDVRLPGEEDDDSQSQLR